MDRLFLLIGSVLGFLGVGLVAFGAHGLKARISADLMAVYQTGVLYHLVHALAVCIVGVIVQKWTHGPIAASGWLFTAGVVVFSGSLYVMALTGIRWLGAITPIGGLCFLAGWACLAVSAWRN